MLFTVNVKTLLPAVEQLLVSVRHDATQLIQLLLAQREVRQSSRAINHAIAGDRATLEGYVTNPTNTSYIHYTTPQIFICI